MNMDLEKIIRISQDILDLREMLRDAEQKLAACMNNNNNNAEPSSGAQINERPYRETPNGKAYRYTGASYVHTAKRNNIGIVQHSETTSLPIAAWLTIEQVEEVRHLVYVQREKIGQKVPAKFKANQ